MTSSSIYFSAVDETRVRAVSNDRGALMELSEHFTFYAEGYKYMQAFRNKMWDGKIRLVDNRNGTFPYGLLAEAVKFLNSREYGCTFDKSLTSREVPSKQEIEEFIDSLPLHAHGENIDFHPYQREGILHACREGRSLILSPTGSGKSLIMYAISRWFLDAYDSRKILVIVPTTSLVEQLIGDYADYSSTDPSFNTQEMCHAIYSGKEKDSPAAQIYVSTWQSAIKMPKEWFTKFGMVIGDEAHTFKAKSLNDIMNRCTAAAYRIGTSGTLDGSLCNEFVLVGNFGPIYKTIRTRDLIDSRTLADLTIKCSVIKHSDEDRKIVSRVDYPTEISALVENPARNRYLTNLAVNQSGNTLVLFNLVKKHGKPLFANITAAAEEGRAVYYVSGEVGAKEREEIRALTEKQGAYTTLTFADNGDSIRDFTSAIGSVQVGQMWNERKVSDVRHERGAIIVASSQTFATGINIRNLHNIIFAAPTKSQIRVLQSIGRGLRTADDGVGTTIYDISDDYSWKKKKNYTLLHAISRIDIYKREGFNFSVEEISV